MAMNILLKFTELGVKMFRGLFDKMRVGISSRGVESKNKCEVCQCTPNMLRCDLRFRWNCIPQISPFGNTYNICIDCYSDKIVKYDELVKVFADSLEDNYHDACIDLNDTYFNGDVKFPIQTYVEKTLKHAGKTPELFWKDVKWLRRCPITQAKRTVNVKKSKIRSITDDWEVSSFQE